MKMIKVFGLSLGILCFSVIIQNFAESAPSEVLKNFIAGILDYKEENYAKAVEDYEAIVKSGWESGTLYYNLGNSYFRDGKIGKAVLNYERAKRIMPRDGDVSFNYNYVRNLVKPYGNAAEESIILKFVRNVYDFYSMSELAWLMAWILAALAAAHLFSLFLKWPGGIRRGVFGALVVLLIFYGTAFWAKFFREKNPAVIVNDTDTTFEPRSDSTVHFRLPEGAKVEILAQEGNWVKVKRPDGKLGWLPSVSAEKI